MLASANLLLLKNFSLLCLTDSQEDSVVSVEKQTISVAWSTTPVDMSTKGA
jgi:hypothetical protein